jgi:hypothetical protein
MVKKPYLVDGGLIVIKSEYNTTPKKRNDTIDKGEMTNSIEPLSMDCHTKESIRRFVERNISINAR